MNKKSIRSIILTEMLHLLSEGTGTFFDDLAKLSKLSSNATFTRFIEQDFRTALADERVVFVPMTKEVNTEMSEYFKSIGADYDNLILARDEKGNLFIHVRNAMNEVKRVSQVTKDAEAFFYLRNPSELARHLEELRGGIDAAVRNIKQVITPQYLENTGKKFILSRKAAIQQGAGIGTVDLSNYIYTELKNLPNSQTLFKGISEEGVREYVELELPSVLEFIEKNKKSWTSMPTESIFAQAMKEGSLFRKSVGKIVDVVLTITIWIVIFSMFQQLVLAQTGLNINPFALFYSGGGSSSSQGKSGANAPVPDKVGG